jgi:hypothetical protein
MFPIMSTADSFLLAALNTLLSNNDPDSDTDGASMCKLVFGSIPRYANSLFFTYFTNRHKIRIARSFRLGRK